MLPAARIVQSVPLSLGFTAASLSSLPKGFLKALESHSNLNGKLELRPLKSNPNQEMMAAGAETPTSLAPQMARL